MPPTPWQNAGFLGSLGEYCVIDATGRGVASCGGPPDNEVANAIARLIAAAPDLLEALIQMVEHDACYRTYRGTDETTCAYCDIVTDGDNEHTPDCIRKRASDAIARATQQSDTSLTGSSVQSQGTDGKH